MQRPAPIMASELGAEGLRNMPLTVTPVSTSTLIGPPSAGLSLSAPLIINYGTAPTFGVSRQERQQREGGGQDDNNWTTAREKVGSAGNRTRVSRTQSDYSTTRPLSRSRFRSRNCLWMKCENHANAIEHHLVTRDRWIYGRDKAAKAAKAAQPSRRRCT